MRIPDKFTPRLQRDQAGNTRSSHHTGSYAEILEVEVHPLGRIWAEEEQLLAVASIKDPQFVTLFSQVLGAEGLLPDLQLKFRWEVKETWETLQRHRGGRS